MLTSAQHKAIEALLTGMTYKDAAKEAGVTRETVTKWANHDCDFKDALHDARMEILKAVVNEFTGEIGKSLRKMTDIRDDSTTPKKEQLAASDKVIQRIIDVTAFVESHETIRRLEEEIQELRNGKPPGTVDSASEGPSRTGEEA